MSAAVVIPMCQGCRIEREPAPNMVPIHNRFCDCDYTKRLGRLTHTKSDLHIHTPPLQEAKRHG